MIWKLFACCFGFPGFEVKRYPPMYENGQEIEENIRIAEEAIRQKIEEIDKED